jgi:hypothetical protein
MITESLPKATKAEHRRKLAKAAEERTRTQTVIPAAKADDSKVAIVVRDTYGFLPGEPIPQREIDEIVGLHNELILTPRRMLEKAFKIGAWFRELKPRVFHGMWEKLLEEKLPQIGLRQVQRYMQLAENQDWLLEKYKSDTRDAFDQLPPIREALADIQTKNSIKELKALKGEFDSIVPKARGSRPARAKEKRSSRPATIEAQSSVVASTEAASPEPVNGCCPTCGRPLR